MEFDEPDFALIDTLFSLAEAHLFMQLIELQDNHPERLPAGKSCADIYRYSSSGAYHLPCSLITVQHNHRLRGGHERRHVSLTHCRDVRAAVDLCHRDGSLKREVAENPAKYIHEVRRPCLPEQDRSISSALPVADEGCQAPQEGVTCSHQHLFALQCSFSRGDGCVVAMGSSLTETNRTPLADLTFCMCEVFRSHAQPQLPA